MTPEETAEFWDISRQEALNDADKLMKVLEKIQHYYTRRDPTIGELIELKKHLNTLCMMFRTDDFYCIWANKFAVEILEVISEIS